MSKDFSISFEIGNGYVQTMKPVRIRCKQLTELAHAFEDRRTDLY